MCGLIAESTENAGDDSTREGLCGLYLHFAHSKFLSLSVLCLSFCLLLASIAIYDCTRRARLLRCAIRSALP